MEASEWDTSEHDWLEGRGPKLYLTAMIDDATRRAFPIIPEGVQLPDSLGALVERVYTPTPPDRHVPRR